MPIIDLVTPWALAEQAGAHAAFRERWSAILEPVRRQRAPSEAVLPPPPDWLVALTMVAEDGLEDRLREARDRLAGRGLRAPIRIVLLAAGAPGAPFEVIPEPEDAMIVLFVDRIVGQPEEVAATSLPSPALGAGVVRPILAALAAGMGQLTRWTSSDNPVAQLAATPPWDRWSAARRVPLAEWIYAAGIAAHAAALIDPDPAVALHLGEGELTRLRRAERSLQERLDAELDETGVGLVLRWLEDGAPLAMRRHADGAIVPRGAGRYLGWRMLAERVDRVGVAEAAAMAA